MPVSYVPPRATVTERETDGETPSTCSRLEISSRFSTLRPACRSVPVALRVMVLAPIEEKESEMELDTPETVVTRAMTAVTPIIMPRMVRNERIRFWRMLETDMRTLSTSMNTLPERLFQTRFMPIPPPFPRSARHQ